MSQRQKSVTFEGPNLRYPQLGDDSAVFHTRASCLWDARIYDEIWAKAEPGRTQKFPGWASGERLLRLIEALRDAEPPSPNEVPVTLHFTGGFYDGASMDCRMDRAMEILYTEPVSPPRVPERGVWYAHARDCPCSPSGAKSIAAGDHIYRPKLEAH